MWPEHDFATVSMLETPVCRQKYRQVCAKGTLEQVAIATELARAPAIFSIFGLSAIFPADASLQSRHNAYAFGSFSISAELTPTA